MQAWVLCATTKSKNVSTNQRQKRGSSLLHTQRRQKESQSQRRSLVAAQTTPPYPTCLAFAWSSSRLLSFSFGSACGQNAQRPAHVELHGICTRSDRRFFSSPSSPHIKRFLSYSLYLPTLNGMPEGKTEDRVRHSFRKLTTFIEN